MAKKRNTPKRKPKVFAEVIRMITKDSLLTLEELTANQDPNELKKDEQGRVAIASYEIPEGCKAVDTLNGTFAYSEARLSRHKEVMETVLQEFSDEFFDLSEGASIVKLRRDKKGRVWADDQTVLHMCYTAIAMDLAMWPYKRKEWAVLPDGVPFIKFTCGKKQNSVKGERHEQTQ